MPNQTNYGKWTGFGHKYGDTKRKFKTRPCKLLLQSMGLISIAFLAVSMWNKSCRLPGRDEGNLLAPLTSTCACDGTGGHAQAPGAASAQQDLLRIPSTVKYLYINIGTSWDPWPGCGVGKGTMSGHEHTGGEDYDPTVFCIYVEPLTRVTKALVERNLITNSSLLVHAAVSLYPGLLPFYEYAGVSGVASSLSPVREHTKTREGNAPYTVGAGQVSAVPVITLKHILDAIPSSIRILQLKTDMQGHDFRALRSAGSSLRRIDEILHECTGAGQDKIYENEDNSYEDVLGYMTSHGFESGAQKSHDCNWRRLDDDGNPVQRVPGHVYIPLTF